MGMGAYPCRITPTPTLLSGWCLSVGVVAFTFAATAQSKIINVK